MLIHPKKRSRYAVQVPLTALIDIVFLLLIYFLLTTNFMVDEGIKIKLPQAKAAAPQTEETITVYVDQQGRAFLGTEELPSARLFERLKAKLGSQENKLVVVRADREAILNKVVKVMDIAKAAGAQKLCLATEKDF
ncbi:MAG: biopolymer transporter ExbD [Desulfobacterales bacterium]|uniref:Biopolymer transporter ExbD n=1 Tax=Candidatus Desulfatibia profunda TaxID=2841695 RepID=A0A8J6NTX8_9BACT|nr:biopolymer transporter ExbD [Candidatus Desulfatibia profunda]MBL7179075.1 biopolymer transporter ExbD [Desulfobacterales bacterium]